MIVSWVLWAAGAELEVGMRKVHLWRGMTPMEMKEWGCIRENLKL